MVTDELLQTFKERMHIFHNGEDDNLKRLLSFSVSYVREKCGEFTLNGDSDIDKRATELAIERARYAYNDALEYFEDNFLSEIISLSLEMAKIEGEDNVEE